MKQIKNVENFGGGKADEVTLPANATPIVKSKNKAAKNTASASNKNARTVASKADSTLATNLARTPDRHQSSEPVSNQTSNRQEHQATLNEDNPLNNRADLPSTMTKTFNQASNQPTPSEATAANKPYPYPDTFIPEIRKTVRKKGTAVVYLRLSADQKRAITKLVHNYNDIEEVSTSETEVAKIGLTALMLDYKKRKKKSFLEKVLKSMYEWD